MSKNNSKPRLSKNVLDLLKNICVVGGATYDFACSKVSDRRLRRLVELNVLKKNKPHRDESVKNKKNRVKDLYSYSLDSIGIEIVIQRGFCTEIQPFNGYRHSEHMQKVVDDLLNNKNIPIQDIFNEKEQLKKFKKQIYNAYKNKIKFAVNDIAYFDSNNNLHSIEIETDYRKNLITKHRNYAEKVLGVKYESHKVENQKRRR